MKLTQANSISKQVGKNRNLTINTPVEVETVFRLQLMQAIVPESCCGDRDSVPVQLQVERNLGSVAHVLVKELHCQCLTSFL
jgi:hypothetical protein